MRKDNKNKKLRGVYLDMGNEFHIFDDFYNSDLTKDWQEFVKSINNHNVNNISEKVKNMETGKNTVKKTDDNFNNLTGNTIEDIKPFDIAVAIANAEAKQEQDNAITLYTNKLTTYINNIIRKISLDGYRICVVNIYDVLDEKFDELNPDRQTEIISNVVYKFRKGGYSIFVSLWSENGTMKKRTIKVSW